MATVNEKMTAIANNIRDKTGGTEALTLDQMASGVNEVYEAGYNEGFKKVIERQAKDIVVPPNVKYIYTSGFYNAPYLENLYISDGVVQIFNMMCQNCKSLKTVRLPATIATVGASLFLGCTSLQEVTFGTVTFTSAISESVFRNCEALTAIKIEQGEFQQSINFQYSPLSVESLKTIITHLKDYSGTDSEFTYTVTFLTSAFEALEAEGNTSPNSNTWTEYIDDLKWNLALA